MIVCLVFWWIYCEWIIVVVGGLVVFFYLEGMWVVLSECMKYWIGYFMLVVLLDS